MSKVLSIGIIPYTYENNEILFFVGHPGGNTTNFWGMLKGMHEENESYNSTALREFYEESGYDLSGYKDQLVDLGMVVQSKHKNVHAFALEIKSKDLINPNKCHSNMADGFPWPEISEYRWMKYDDVIKYTHPSHKEFYDKILQIEQINNF